MSDDLEQLLKSIEVDLGDPAEWPAPVEFRDSLALCVLNSVYSLRASSPSVVNVLNRYRAARPSADTDSGSDLLEAIGEAGGPEAFAHNVLRNGRTLPGTKRLRTIGIHEALTKFETAEVAVHTAAELRQNAKNPAVKRAWLSVVGLGKLSWAYLLMNAGVDAETKPDVMLQRFTRRALGSEGQVTPERTRQLLMAAAGHLDVQPRRLDRAIWWHESPYGQVISRS